MKLVWLAVGLSLATPAAAQNLAVQNSGEWRTWWTAAHPTARWIAALPPVEAAVGWRSAAPGLEWGELELAAAGRTRAVVVRVDPRRYRFNLETDDGWTVGSADAAAAMAVNAGDAGWVVHGGHEARAPSANSQSSAVVFEAAGNVTLVDGSSIPAVRSAGYAFEAFQSAPTLITGDGDVPRALLTGDGIDVTRREARLAMGELRDGRLLFVLAPVQPGLTIPEISAVMGALGCRRAVALEDGASSQLLIRERNGSEHAWKAGRKVPMGLIATPRPQ